MTDAGIPHNADALDAPGSGPVGWYGGKGQLLPRLLPLIPDGGRLYVEPYMGGAAVLFARRPALSEVINDLDEDLVTMFRVLQDPRTFDALAHRLRYTLYSRSEYARALEILRNRSEDPVSRAWAFFVRQNQGMAGIPSVRTVGTWGRSFGSPNTATQFARRVDALARIHRRLRHVQIDQRDALEVIRYWDTPDTVFYVDPPYLSETRSSGSRNVYAHELTHDAHVHLLETLMACQGAIVLSGYAHPVYDALDRAGWIRTSIPTACYAAAHSRISGIRGTGAALARVPRVECVWQNPRALEMLRGVQQRLPL